MNSIGILEREQLLSDAPRHFVSRRDAKHLEAHGLIRPVRKNAANSEGVLWSSGQGETIYQLSVGLKKGIRNPIGKLLKRYADPGGLLPPLDFYMPFTDLPLWLIRIYRSHDVGRSAA